MNERPHAPDLFARITSDQDAALAASAHHQEDLGRALIDRMTARAARGSRLRAVLGGGAAVALVAVAAFAWGLRTRALDFQVGDARLAGAAGAPLQAQADSELPLRFSDGSTITFQPGSRGRVDRLASGGSDVELLDGRLEAAVVHARQTRWLVRTGPFSVQVTGTRFSVDWRAAAGQLVVDVREGAVIVAGGVLGAGVPLRAGQRLSVAAGDGQPPVLRSEPIAVGVPAVPVMPAAAAPAPRAAAAGSDGRAAGSDWRALASRGAHAEAMRAAERQGLVGLRRRLDARGLLALGDVARFARAPEEARRAFEALVERFPDDRLAGDAVFSLGRLAIEDAHPREAAQWFARYVQKWPEGALAEQAGGRLLEAARAGGDRALIERAATQYLRRSPAGPHASLARMSLEDLGSDPPPADDR